jgi:hypothetical protein
VDATCFPAVPHGKFRGSTLKEVLSAFFCALLNLSFKIHPKLLAIKGIQTYKLWLAFKDEN